jgi:hypothetical protein
VVLETVEILIPLLADVALVRLLLLHSLGPRIWGLRIGVNDRECPVSVFMKSLIIVTVLACR